MGKGSNLVANHCPRLENDTTVSLPREEGDLIYLNSCEKSGVYNISMTKEGKPGLNRQIVLRMSKELLMERIQETLEMTTLDPLRWSSESRENPMNGSLKSGSRKRTRRRRKWGNERGKSTINIEGRGVVRTWSIRRSFGAE